jgi:hypothetical protein
MFFSFASTPDDGDSDNRDVRYTSSESSSEAIEPTHRKSALNSAFVPSAIDDDAPEQGSVTDVSLGSRASFSSGDGESSVSSESEAKELDLEGTNYDEPGSVGQNLRITYLLVTLVIMLADGLQGMYGDCLSA